MKLTDRSRQHRAAPRSAAVLRGLLVFAGGALVVVALSVDRLGYGRPGSFGRGQFLLLLAGVGTVVVGLLGRRTVPFYRGAAIVFLNTVVLLLFMELTAIVIFWSGMVSSTQPNLLARYGNLPYYRAQEWTATYWREVQAAEIYRYSSYTGWRHRPFQGETVNVDRQGVRRTPGSECGADALRVFVFGGSTMWGWGSPDWGTIAAYLQKSLQSGTSEPICVINFGEDAYVSTQGLIELTRQLRAGNVPDAVVFYDGVNDVFAAWRNGGTEEHGYLIEFASRMEKEDEPTLRWLESSRVFRMMEQLRQRLRRAGEENRLQVKRHPQAGTETPDLAAAVVATYLANYRMVRALANENGFLYFFFWQPQMGLGRKILTEDEQAMRLGLSPELLELTRESHELLPRQSSGYLHLRSMADALDALDEQVWIDEFGHVTPIGNRVIAQKMSATMAEPLALRLEAAH